MMLTQTEAVCCLADVWRPATRLRLIIYDAVLILAGSGLIAVSAQIALPVRFSPVPITGQTLSVLLVGALLGSWRGGLTVVAYLLEGIAGLPVFSSGEGGLIRLFGPTGGYLVGFVAAAAVVGALAERGWDRRWFFALLAMTAGNLVIHAFGLVWLARFTGWPQALAKGCYPFIPGDILKLLLATAALPAGRKWGHDSASCPLRRLIRR